MHRTRLSIIAALTALLLAGCGKDAAPGNVGSTGEDGLPKPDAVSGSVTGMPNPGESTPNPGQPVEIPVEDELEVPADIVPIDGELPTDIDGLPQTATPEPPEPETMPLPPTESAVPASSSDNPDVGLQ